MNGDRPPSLLSHRGLKGNCFGLRSYEPPTSVKVYKANLDGTIGELIRTEESTFFKQPFRGNQHTKKVSDEKNTNQYL